MYILIVIPKVHVFTIFITFIYFCDFFKRKKIKENDFIFLKNFGYIGSSTPLPQGYEYPRSIWYGVRLHFLSIHASWMKCRWVMLTNAFKVMVKEIFNVFTFIGSREVLILK